MRGYIFLHRKLREWPYYGKSEGKHVALWVEMLLLATHKEYDVMWCGERITLKPGQFITGRKSLESATGVNEHFIYRSLKRYEKAEQIEQVTSGRSTLFTIINWHEYQIVEQVNEQDLSSHRATSEQPVSTNKNVKNKRPKPLRASFNGTYPDHFEDAWTRYGKKGSKQVSFTRYELHVNSQDLGLFMTSIGRYLDMCKKDDRTVRDMERFIYRDGEAYWMNFTEDIPKAKHPYRD